MGDLHGGGHPVPLLGLPVLTQGDEHAGVPVALVGVVVVGEEDLFELALVGEKRLGGGEEEPCQGAIAGQGTPGAVVRDSSLSQPLLGWEVPPGKSGYPDFHRVRRGTPPVPSNCSSRHLPGTWEPEQRILSVRLKTAVLPTGTRPGGSRQQLLMAPLTRWQVTTQGLRERWPCLGPGPLLWAGWASQVAQ